MSNLLIFDPISLTLWVAATIVLVICSLNYLLRGLKKDNKNERVLMFGFAGLWLGFALLRIFFFWSYFIIEGYYIGHSFYGSLEDSTLVFDILRKAGYLSGVIGFLIYYLAIEHVIKKTRYLLTLVDIVFLVIMIFMPLETVLFLFYVLGGINGVGFMISYLFTSKDSNKEMQGVLTLMVSGLVIFLAGLIMDSNEIRELAIFSFKFVSNISHNWSIYRHIAYNLES